MLASPNTRVRFPTYLKKPGKLADRRITACSLGINIRAIGESLYNPYSRKIAGNITRWSFVLFILLLFVVMVWLFIANYSNCTKYFLPDFTH
jgi:hypothetical protein